MMDLLSPVVCGVDDEGRAERSLSLRLLLLIDVSGAIGRVLLCIG